MEESLLKKKPEHVGGGTAKGCQEIEIKHNNKKTKQTKKKKQKKTPQKGKTNIPRRGSTRKRGKLPWGEPNPEHGREGVTEGKKLGGSSIS